jgi:predicted kinase
MKITICRGLPASGKSTYAKQWVIEDPEKRVRVNRDDIRRMLGKYWVPNRENLVTHIEERSVIEALRLGYNVIIDATHIKSKKDLIRKWTRTILYNIEFKDFFDVSVEECMRRDAERGDEKVGNAVISKFNDQLIEILKDE